MLFENVKRLCQEAGLSITDLEERLGFGNGTIGKWKSRGTTPGIDKVAAIAQFFGTTIDALMSDPQSTT